MLVKSQNTACNS